MSRSLIRNTVLYLPAQVLGPFVQFAVMVAWTHLLDPADFGVITFIVAAQELTAFLGLGWWSLYMLRFRQRYEGDGDTRLRAMDSRMALSGSLSQALFAPVCLLAIHSEADVSTMAAAAAYLVSRMLVVHYSEWARSQHRIAAYSFAQIVGPILGSGLSVVALLAFGRTPAVALTTMAVGQAVGAAGLMMTLGLRPRIGDFDRTIFRDAGRYGFPLILSALFSWAAINGVRVLVEEGVGVVGLGLLSAGWGLGQRVANFVAMICTAAAFPIAVDRIESGDRAGALQQVSLNGALMLALLAPAVAGVATLSEPLVRLLIAEQYRDITIFVLPVAVAVGALRTYRMHTTDQATMLLERMRTLAVTNLGDALVTLACAAVGLKFGGIEGAVVGCLVGAALATGAAAIYATGWLDLRIPFGAYARILLAVAAMAAPLALTPAPQTTLWLAVKIGLGAALYFLVLSALFGEARAMIRNRLVGLYGRA